MGSLKAFCKVAGAGSPEQKLGGSLSDEVCGFSSVKLR
jgi:hypothetical protein